MTIFERIEKKIFFRLLSFIIFIIAFLSFVAVVTGTITISMPSFSKQSSEISVHKSEIDAVLKPEPKQ